MAWNADGQKICIVYEDGKYFQAVSYSLIKIISKEFKKKCAKYSL